MDWTRRRAVLAFVERLKGESKEVLYPLYVKACEQMMIPPSSLEAMPSGLALVYRIARLMSNEDLGIDGDTFPNYEDSPLEKLV